MKARLISVTEREFYGMITNARKQGLGVSFSLDERDNTWIFAEAAKYDKCLYTIPHTLDYCIIYPK